MELAQIHSFHESFNAKAQYKVRCKASNYCLLELQIREWNKFQKCSQFFTYIKDDASRSDEHQCEHPPQLYVFTNALSKWPSRVVHAYDRRLQPPLVDKHY